MDDVAGTLAEIDRTGVGRALVHAPHAAAYDSRELWGVIFRPPLVELSRRPCQIS